ncbi:hypothetical protein C1H46_004157 [Malus baccata]|uniref:Uncharacterized protein n=1 Tax=Malus baccata TaxID=106549 RepID=A0A540NGM0_MALBA|nr:hypothetical protein C1H46_004157 [Malus baccata]
MATAPASREKPVWELQSREVARVQGLCEGIPHAKRGIKALNKQKMLEGGFTVDGERGCRRVVLCCMGLDGRWVE